MSCGARPVRLGVFGGTFDPPHLGHIAAAEAARDALDLDLVLLVVAGEPWQKSGEVEASPEDRFCMVARAVESVSRVSASRVEIERSGPSYTAETLELLGSPQGQAWIPRELRGRPLLLHLIVGADAAARMHTWHRAGDLPDLARIVVVSRAAETSPAGGLLETARHVEMRPVPVSSSDVRRQLEAGGIPENQLPDAVVEVIRERNLYGLGEG